MAPMIAYTLPAMQLVCNLVIPQAPNLTINNVDSGVATGASDNRNVSVVKELPGLDHDVTPTSNPPVTPSLPTIQAKTLPDGYLSFPKFGVAWKAHNETATYPVAAKRCVEEGGNLAVIDSWRKFNVVQQLLSKDDEHYFVGITRMYETKDWVDVRTVNPFIDHRKKSGLPFLTLVSCQNIRCDAGNRWKTTRTPGTKQSETNFLPFRRIAQRAL
ncbi:uncharacterized protein LOC124405516 isoform X1 [Diprion similis]|uniref:uncharacterized protein LOC124405516 isoform X1 n=1 Tax=Diprion similis TaxID=362088 RepID=UPI001EF8DD33|nr:uncharacterized protein LOC124405516 isoform X1 [Diprion similis]